MKRTAFIASTAALAVCGGASPNTTLASSISPSAGPITALTGMTVVNTRDGTLAQNMTIIIQSGKIVNVAPTGSFAVPISAVVATGGFVVPGFNDMHAHPLTWPDVPAALNTMLAYGITGFRQMSGSAAMLAARANGTLMQPGQPALLQIPGDILTPVNATSAAATTALVDAQIAQGADFIKSVGITGAPFNAAIAEASARGKGLTGHLSTTDDVRVVTAAGMTGIEHMGPRDSASAAPHKKPRFVHQSHRYRQVVQASRILTLRAT